MGKTIKQLADELGVSKTAVRKKMAVLFGGNTGNQFAETVSGIIYITVFGEKLIKQAFLGSQTANQFPVVSENQFVEVSSQVSNLKSVIETLNKQLEQKDVQIAEKDKQIAKLQAALFHEQENTKMAQQLHGVDKVSLIADGSKKRWWIFGKR
jgi:outer membrane murein-binding lipoprotein Lpp